MITLGMWLLKPQRRRHRRRRNMDKEMVEAALLILMPAPGMRENKHLEHVLVLWCHAYREAWAELGAKSTGVDGVGQVHSVFKFLVLCFTGVLDVLLFSHVVIQVSGN